MTSKKDLKKMIDIIAKFRTEHWLDMNIAVTIAAVTEGESKIRVFLNDQKELDWEIIE